jgi:predicted PP-loop superfamily ATPase
MPTETLNKACNICNSITMGAEEYFSEFVKDANGRGNYNKTYICGNCSSAIKRRLMRMVVQVMPRALRETMIHTIKGGK